MERGSQTISSIHTREGRTVVSDENSRERYVTQTEHLRSSGFELAGELTFLKYHPESATILLAYDCPLKKLLRLPEPKRASA